MPGAFFVLGNDNAGLVVGHDGIAVLQRLGPLFYAGAGEEISRVCPCWHFCIPFLFSFHGTLGSTIPLNAVFCACDQIVLHAF